MQSERILDDKDESFKLFASLLVALQPSEAFSTGGRLPRLDARTTASPRIGSRHRASSIDMQDGLFGMGGGGAGPSFKVVTDLEFPYNQEFGYVDKAGLTYIPTRLPGGDPQTARVKFTVPGDDVPKCIDFKYSYDGDKPSFSAVKVSLPFGANVRSKDLFQDSGLTQPRVFVDSPPANTGALKALLRGGDIIRAVSAPAGSSIGGGGGSILGLISGAPPSAAGMIILDQGQDAGFRAALDASESVGEVTLIVERPSSDQNDGGRNGGLGQKVKEGLDKLLNPGQAAGAGGGYR